MFSFEEFPNELLNEILSYLHSDEIIYSFLNLNVRFYSLCIEYIERINLSTSTNIDRWNSKNFQLIPPLIRRMKLNDIQLDWIFDCPENIPIYFPQLQSIQLRILSQNELYKQYLKIFKQTISSLTIDYQNATLFSRIDHEILHEFLVDDSSIKLDRISINGICLSIDCQCFQICRTLKRLKISVEYQHHLFILLEYLPELEYLNISIREGKAGQYDYNYSKTKSLSLKLREMILSGNDLNFNDLNLLFHQCQSTLQILKLRLKVTYIIDGFLLESLKRSLKQLSFYIFCHSLNESSPSSDEILLSYQSPIWLNNQLVMFFRNSYYRTYTIVSPPSHCRVFNCSLTNEFINYRLNSPNELFTMEKIKRIYLNDKQQSRFSSKFFQMIKSIFINLEILEIGFDFDLFEDIETRLTRVHTLIIVNNENPMNVKYLFELLPNIRRLEIDYDLLLNHLYNSFLKDDQQLQEILIHFKPNQRFQIDQTFRKQIQSIYKNAKILS